MNSKKLKQLFPALGRDLPPPNAKVVFLGALALLCLFQFFRTYMRWPDPIVDFGREIYVPWQMAEGRALLRDIPYFQGPFSPWLNALWFRLFGTGLLTLAWANLAVFLGIVFLLFEVLERIADRFAAFWGCFLAIAVFGFGQYMNTGNYNFITPYAHEVSHGMFLSLLGLLTADAIWRKRRRHSAIFLGVLHGALFLTKPEMFAAGISGGVALFGYGLLTEWCPERKRWLAGTAWRWLLGFALVLAAAFAALLRANDSITAFRGILGGFYQLLDSQVTANPFQAWVSGFDDVVGNTIILCAMALAWVLLFLAGGYADRWFTRRWPWKPGMGVILLAILVLILSSVFSLIPFSLLPRAFPVFGLFLFFHLLPGGKSELGQAVPVAHRPLAFGFAVFSLVILLRMILRVRFMHYGFAFALPISLLLVAAVGGWIPKMLQRRYGGGKLAKVFLVYAVLAFSFFHYRIDLLASYQRLFPVSPRPEDAFLVNGPSAQVFGVLNQALDTLVKPNQTLVVIPEGVMINYLHRLYAPGGYTSYLPIVFDIFGEKSMLGRFEAEPPDFVLYYFVSGAEWGKPDFGKDYGTELGAYIENNYESVWLFGAHPFDGSGKFGMELFQRKAHL